MAVEFATAAEDRQDPGRRLRSRPRSRSLTALICVALLALGVVAGTFLLAPRLKTAEQAAADALPPAARPVTASVEERVLTEEVVLRGMVVPGDSIAVLPTTALAAVSPVVTDVPVTGGQVVAAGAVVLEANGEPVFAMDWNFAPYRDITGGSRGPDVVQLQDTLAALGYATSSDGLMDPLTQSGLAALYRDRGYTAPLTGAGGTASGTTASGTVATTVPGATDGTPPAPGAEPGGKAPAPSPGDPYLPAAGVLLVPAGLHTVSQVLPAVGSHLSDPAAPVLRLDAGQNIAVAVLDPGTAATYSTGDAALLVDSRNGAEHPLRVESVGAEPADVDGLGAGVRVVFAFTGTPAAPTPAGSTLLIRAVQAGDPEPVTAVPVTALYARADGTSFVTVSAPAGAGASDPAGSRDVTVKPGRDVGGWVAVELPEPGTLAVGDSVIVGISRGE